MNRTSIPARRCSGKSRSVLGPNVNVYCIDFLRRGHRKLHAQQSNRWSSASALALVCAITASNAQSTPPFEIAVWRAPSRAESTQGCPISLRSPMRIPSLNHTPPNAFYGHDVRIFCAAPTRLPTAQPISNRPILQTSFQKNIDKSRQYVDITSKSRTHEATFPKPLRGRGTLG